LNGGLNFDKGWVAAGEDIWLSTIDGAGGGLTLERFRGAKKNI